MEDLTLSVYIISRCTHNYYARELKKIGITMGQFGFIMQIAANDGISQEKLSSKMKISKSTTTSVIQQLIDSEIVVREVDLQDRRNYQLHLTAKGIDLLPKIQHVIDHCHELLTNTLGEKEFLQFENTLRKIKQNAETVL